MDLSTDSADSALPGRYNLRTRKPPSSVVVNHNQIIDSPRRKKEKRSSNPPRSKLEPSVCKVDAPTVVRSPVKNESRPHFDVLLYSMPGKNEQFQKQDLSFVEHNSYKLVRIIVPAQPLNRTYCSVTFMSTDLDPMIMEAQHALAVKGSYNVDTLKHRLLLRIGIPSTTKPSTDFLPKVFFLRANAMNVQVKNVVRSIPYDMSWVLRSENLLRNKNKIQVLLNVTEEGNQEYIFGIYLMQKIPHEEHLKTLKSKFVSSVKWSQTLLDKMLKPQDGVTCVDTSLVVSLLCPISATRIKTPCRGVHCRHFQCFDGETFIQLNQAQQAKWRCPVCKEYLKLNDLLIDGVYKHILEQIPDCPEVRIFPDCTYRTSKDNKRYDPYTSPKRQVTGQNGHAPPPAKKPKIEYITIESDSDDDEIQSCMAPQHHANYDSTTDDSDSDIELVFENLPSRPHCR